VAALQLMKTLLNGPGEAQSLHSMINTHVAIFSLF